MQLDSINLGQFSLSIVNMCLISAIMAMGANIQWGYAGLVNFGIMGFTALGGLAAVLVSYSPVREAWSVGGSQYDYKSVNSNSSYFCNKICT